MATAVDPVCHMEVDTEKPPGGKSEYQGQTYYFCAPGCKKRFQRDPEAFIRDSDGGSHP